MPPTTRRESTEIPKNAITVSGELVLAQEVTLDGLIPQSIPDGSSMKIVAALPGGGTQPLVWLYEYKNSYQHPFLFRTPINLPAGTVIRGVPPEAKLVLLPGKKRSSK